MSSISALKEVHKKGNFGDFREKKEAELIKISEVKDLLIIQIVQYKNSNLAENISIDGLKLDNTPLNVNCNNETRIFWNGPKNWLLTSTKKELIKNISEIFIESDFAVTDLSHSRAVIQLEGPNVKEVLKKGCPYNFNILEKNNSINSTYNGIALTIDMLDNNPETVRLFALRSFGESLYHSITDACLEFGYKSI
ncbi:sarcosine oxidase [Candidatus Pelagibacter sp. HIMB1623]|uniref:sarcosine oxidase n=1 Tax=Candidatus Pelagibacter sp. HIMB1623 TaxID=3413358 RepID=UPI003F84265C